MPYLITNYVVLVVGMLLIGLFWNFLTRKESEKDRKAVRLYSTAFLVLGVIMFTIQYFASAS